MTDLIQSDVKSAIRIIYEKAESNDRVDLINWLTLDTNGEETSCFRFLSNVTGIRATGLEFAWEKSFSFNLWIRTHAAEHETDGCIFRMQLENGQGIEVLLSKEKLDSTRLVTINLIGNHSNLTATGNIFLSYKHWHMLTISSRTAYFKSPSISVYIDGCLQFECEFSFPPFNRGSEVRWTIGERLNADIASLTLYEKEIDVDILLLLSDLGPSFSTPFHPLPVPSSSSDSGYATLGTILTKICSPSDQSMHISDRSPKSSSSSKCLAERISALSIGFHIDACSVSDLNDSRSLISNLPRCTSGSHGCEYLTFESVSATTSSSSFFGFSHLWPTTVVSSGMASDVRVDVGQNCGVELVRGSGRSEEWFAVGGVPVIVVLLYGACERVLNTTLSSGNDDDDDVIESEVQLAESNQMKEVLAIMDLLASVVSMSIIFREQFMQIHGFHLVSSCLSLIPHKKLYLSETVVDKCVSLVQSLKIDCRVGDGLIAAYQGLLLNLSLWRGAGKKCLAYLLSVVSMISAESVPALSLTIGIQEMVDIMKSFICYADDSIDSSSSSSQMADLIAVADSAFRQVNMMIDVVLKPQEAALRNTISVDKESEKVLSNCEVVSLLKSIEESVEQIREYPTTNDNAIPLNAVAHVVYIERLCRLLDRIREDFPLVAMASLRYINFTNGTVVSLIKSPHLTGKSRLTFLSLAFWCLRCDVMDSLTSLFDADDKSLAKQEEFLIKLIKYDLSKEYSSLLSVLASEWQIDCAYDFESVSESAETPKLRGRVIRYLSVVFGCCESLIELCRSIRESINSGVWGTSIQTDDLARLYSQSDDTTLPVALAQQRATKLVVDSICDNLLTESVSVDLWIRIPLFLVFFPHVRVSLRQRMLMSLGVQLKSDTSGIQTLLVSLFPDQYWIRPLLLVCTSLPMSRLPFNWTYGASQNTIPVDAEDDEKEDSTADDVCCELGLDALSTIIAFKTRFSGKHAWRIWSVCLDLIRDSANVNGAYSQDLYLILIRKCVTMALQRLTRVSDLLDPSLIEAVYKTIIIAGKECLTCGLRYRSLMLENSASSTNDSTSSAIHLSPASPSSMSDSEKQLFCFIIDAVTAIRRSVESDLVMTPGAVESSNFPSDSQSSYRSKNKRGRRGGRRGGRSKMRFQAKNSHHVPMATNLTILEAVCRVLMSGLRIFLDNMTSMPPNLCERLCNEIFHIIRFLACFGNPVLDIAQTSDQKVIYDYRVGIARDRLRYAVFQSLIMLRVCVNSEFGISACIKSMDSKAVLSAEGDAAVSTSLSPQKPVDPHQNVRIALFEQQDCYMMLVIRIVRFFSDLVVRYGIDGLSTASLDVALCLSPVANADDCIQILDVLVDDVLSYSRDESSFDDDSAIDCEVVSRVLASFDRQVPARYRQNMMCWELIIEQCLIHGRRAEGDLRTKDILIAINAWKDDIDDDVIVIQPHTVEERPESSMSKDSSTLVTDDASDIALESDVADNLQREVSIDSSSADVENVETRQVSNESASSDINVLEPVEALNVSHELKLTPLDAAKNPLGSVMLKERILQERVRMGAFAKECLGRQESAHQYLVTISEKYYVECMESGSRIVGNSPELKRLASAPSCCSSFDRVEWKLGIAQEGPLYTRNRVVLRPSRSFIEGEKLVANLSDGSMSEADINKKVALGFAGKIRDVREVVAIEEHESKQPDESTAEMSESESASGMAEDGVIVESNKKTDTESDAKAALSASDAAELAEKENFVVIQAGLMTKDRTGPALGGCQTIGSDDALISEKVVFISPGKMSPGTISVSKTHIMFVSSSRRKENDEADALMHLRSQYESVVGCDYDDEELGEGSVKRKKYRWLIDAISAVLLRRYRLRDSAIEIFFRKGRHRSLFIDFGHSSLDIARKSVFLAQLDKIRPYASYLQKESAGFSKVLRDLKLQRKWMDGELSNFEYLMALNTISGRSYNDLGQYPVMPWILQQYTEDRLDLSDVKNYRDLSKPIGALNDGRLKEILDRYESFDDGTIPKFMYGSHYSTMVGVVLHYLVRLQPFAQLHKEIQGGKFDVADRVFASIPESWQYNTHAISEVKEITPEWFCLSEFLRNCNTFDFGKRQDSSVVNDVELPPWAHSPEEFIRINRDALESDFVSAHLHEWIDLIFGYKQQGPAAVEANNVFYYLTYYQSVNLDSIDDDSLREAMELQIAHFGQCPAQMFTAPHPSRPVALPFHVPRLSRQSFGIVSGADFDGVLALSKFLDTRSTDDLQASTRQAAGSDATSIHDSFSQSPREFVEPKPVEETVTRRVFESELNSVAKLELCVQMSRLDPNISIRAMFVSTHRLFVIDNAGVVDAYSWSGRSIQRDEIIVDDGAVGKSASLYADAKSQQRNREIDDDDDDESMIVLSSSSGQYPTMPVKASPAKKQAGQSPRHQPGRSSVRSVKQRSSPSRFGIPTGDHVFTKFITAERIKASFVTLPRIECESSARDASFTSCLTRFGQSGKLAFSTSHSRLGVIVNELDINQTVGLPSVPRQNYSKGYGLGIPLARSMFNGHLFPITAIATDSMPLSEIEVVASGDEGGIMMIWMVTRHKQSLTAKTFRLSRRPLRVFRGHVSGSSVSSRIACVDINCSMNIAVSCSGNRALLFSTERDELLHRIDVVDHRSVIIECILSNLGYLVLLVSREEEGSSVISHWLYFFTNNGHFIDKIQCPSLVTAVSCPGHGDTIILGHEKGSLTFWSLCGNCRCVGIWDQPWYLELDYSEDEGRSRAITSISVGPSLYRPVVLIAATAQGTILVIGLPDLLNWEKTAQQSAIFQMIDAPIRSIRGTVQEAGKIAEAAWVNASKAASGAREFATAAIGEASSYWQTIGASSNTLFQGVSSLFGVKQPATTSSSEKKK